MERKHYDGDHEKLLNLIAAAWKRLSQDQRKATLMILRALGVAGATPSARRMPKHEDSVKPYEVMEEQIEIMDEELTDGGEKWLDNNGGDKPVRSDQTNHNAIFGDDGVIANAIYQIITLVENKTTK